MRGRASLWNGRGWPYGTKVFSNSVYALSSKAIFPYSCLLQFSLSFFFSLIYFLFSLILFYPLPLQGLTFFSFFSGMPRLQILMCSAIPFPVPGWEICQVCWNVAWTELNSGRAGEGVKTEDWEALKQNTIVIVLIFISIATPMQYFSLTPGIPLLWSPAGLSLETSNGTGTGKVPVGIVGKWMRFEEISSNLLVQCYGLPLRCGTDQTRRFVIKEQKGSCWDGDGSWCSRQQ